MTKRTTRTAGGVVVGPHGKVVVVSQGGRSWSLPKGHIEAGETAMAAALREIAEETGLTQIILKGELGSYERYKMGMNPNEEDTTELKLITIFLFATQEQVLAPQDPHNPEARWVEIADVADMLTSPQDKAFFRQITPQITELLR